MSIWIRNQYNLVKKLVPSKNQDNQPNSRVSRPSESSEFSRSIIHWTYDCRTLETAEVSEVLYDNLNSSGIRKPEIQETGVSPFNVSGAALDVEQAAVHNVNHHPEEKLVAVNVTPPDPERYKSANYSGEEFVRAELTNGVIVIGTLLGAIGARLAQKGYVEKANLLEIHHSNGQFRTRDELAAKAVAEEINPGTNPHIGEEVDLNNFKETKNDKISFVDSFGNLHTSKIYEELKEVKNSSEADLSIKAKVPVDYWNKLEDEKESWKLERDKSRFLTIETTIRLRKSDKAVFGFKNQEMGIGPGSWGENQTGSEDRYLDIARRANHPSRANLADQVKEHLSIEIFKKLNSDENLDFEVQPDTSIESSSGYLIEVPKSSQLELDRIRIGKPVLEGAKFEVEV